MKVLTFVLGLLSLASVLAGLDVVSAAFGFVFWLGAAHGVRGIVRTVRARKAVGTVKVASPDVIAHRGTPEYERFRARMESLEAVTEARNEAIRQANS